LNGDIYLFSISPLRPPGIPFLEGKSLDSRADAYVKPLESAPFLISEFAKYTPPSRSVAAS
jgi:hypothetical protein